MPQTRGTFPEAHDNRSRTMSPFRSKAQQRAAFGGYLGAEMKEKAPEWAHETPNLKSLPQHVRGAKKGGGYGGHSARTPKRTGNGR